jgi:O-antigen/teichoic acid export membrane protein
MTVGATLYGVALWGGGAAIMVAVYSGRYASHVHLLGYIALLPILTALASGSQIGFRALQRPWAILIGYAISALLTATLGLMAVWRWGVQGAALGLTLSSGTYALVLYGLARKQSPLMRSRW